MGHRLENGECVACGRYGGRLRDACPFCGERIWHSPLFQAGRILAPLVWFALLAAFAAAGECRLLRPLPAPRDGFLLAAGMLLALWPRDDSADIHTSAREMLRARLDDLLLQLAVFVSVLLVAPHPAGAIILLPLAAFPYFFGLPWRALLGCALLFL